MKYFVFFKAFFFVKIFAIFSFFVHAQNTVERIPQGESSIPTINYGQIFIEETTNEKKFPFELAVSGGQIIGNPYLESDFFSLGMKHKIHSFLYLGIEYSIYNSKLHSAMMAIEKTMNLYGMDLNYSFLKSSFYVNWYYRFFKSHINAASFFKMNMELPIYFGFGLMETDDTAQKMLFAFKWGAGPRVHLTDRWSVQLSLSQILAIKKEQLLYTAYSFSCIYSL